MNGFSKRATTGGINIAAAEVAFAFFADVRNEKDRVRRAHRRGRLERPRKGEERRQPSAVVDTPGPFRTRPLAALCLPECEARARCPDGAVTATYGHDGRPPSALQRCRRDRYERHTHTIGTASPSIRRVFLEKSGCGDAAHLNVLLVDHCRSRTTHCRHSRTPGACASSARKLASGGLALSMPMETFLSVADTCE
jgi:hypothetical protein